MIRHAGTTIYLQWGEVGRSIVFNRVRYKYNIPFPNNKVKLVYQLM